MKTLIFVLLFSLPLQAKIFNCEFNIASPGQVVKADQVANFVKKISFDTSSKDGKVINLGGASIFLWHKKFHINVKYEDKARNITFTTQYFPARDSFSLKVEPHNQLTCSSRGAAKKASASAVIDPNKDLGTYTNGLWVKTNSELKFFYYQKNIVDRMRPIIFQDGKVLTADSARDIEGNWCIFNIQVKLDEDTYISRGTKIEVMSFNILSNNPTHNVYAYNFVDIGQGRKRSETSRYAPFSLECKVKKSQTFNLQLFKQITGNRLSLYLNKK